MFGKKMSNYEQNETQIPKIYRFSILVFAYFFLNFQKSLFFPLPRGANSARILTGASQEVVLYRLQ